MLSDFAPDCMKYDNSTDIEEKSILCNIEIY